MLFKSIATFATFALSAVSVFAAPSAEPAPLVERAKPNGIAKIFADATTALTPHTQQLQSLTAGKMNVATVQPVTNEITGVLNGVITDVQLLLGEPVDVILATVDGTAVLTVSELSVIVSELVHLVLGAVGSLLKFPFGTIQFLLFDLGQLVGTLVNTVVLVTDELLFGLSSAISSLLFDLDFVVTDLGLTLLGGLLGILL